MLVLLTETTNGNYSLSPFTWNNSIPLVCSNEVEPRGERRKKNFMKSFNVRNDLFFRVIKIHELMSDMYHGGGEDVRSILMCGVMLSFLRWRRGGMNGAKKNPSKQTFWPSFHFITTCFVTLVGFRFSVTTLPSSQWRWKSIATPTDTNNEQSFHWLRNADNFSGKHFPRTSGESE